MKQLRPRFLKTLGAGGVGAATVRVENATEHFNLALGME
jgi:hypothetical protein